MRASSEAGFVFEKTDLGFAVPQRSRQIAVMQTITVELLDDQVIGPLQQLEKIQWLRIVRKPESSKAKQPRKGGKTPDRQEMSQVI